MAGTIPPPHHQYSPWSAPATPQVPPPLAVHGSFDEVRTIFVLGFPPDVKERELQNLLRWWPGYEASQINFKGGQPMGFALFSTAAIALSARDALQNLVFDAETDSVLRAEMAKKNLYVKRGVTGVSTDTASFDQSKRIRTGGDYSPAQYGPSRAFDSSASPAWGSQSYIAPAASYDPYGGYSVPSVQPGAQHVPQPVAPVGYAPVQNLLN